MLSPLIRRAHDPSSDVLDQAQDINAGAVWVPRRAVVDLDNIASQHRLDTVVAASTPDASTPSAPAGAPYQVINPSATESPAKVQGRTMSEVSVSFSRDTSDPNYGGARVWFTGYRGSQTPWLVAEGSDAPITFLCETTGESVTVTVQAISADGTPGEFDSAPSCTVLLDGVVSSPPAPSISQTLTGVPLGYQFAFNQVGLSAGTQDVIAAYRVYKNSTNVSGSATLLRTFQHDPTALGAIVVQDNVGGGQTFYYWVSTVNTAKLESTLTAAQSGAVVSGVAASTDLNTNVPQNTTNNATVDSIDAGTSATVRVYGPSGVGNGWTRYVGSTTFAMPYITITGASYTTKYFVYCNKDGSSPQITTSAFATLPDGLAYCGTVTTVASGGGGGTGGGGGSGGTCFSGNVEVQCPRGLRRLDAVPCNFTLVTSKGVRRAELIKHDFDGPMIDMGEGRLVTLDHPVRYERGWRPAWQHFVGKRIVHYTGTVYNLHVLDNDPEAHNYYLRAGENVHNLLPFNDK